MMLLQAQPATEPSVLGLSTTGWIAIGALVTALMAVATGYLAWKSRSEASAARDTVTEIQKDRELTFRPYVSWKIGEGVSVLAVNFGRGPALHTMFCKVDQDDRWKATPEDQLIDMSPGEKITAADKVYLVTWPGAQAASAPARPQVGQTVPRQVAFCEDQLGNRYRFLQGKVDADVWHAGELKPDWVVWYEAHAHIAART
jgi:hypothetical protein